MAPVVRYHGEAGGISTGHVHHTQRGEWGVVPVVRYHGEAGGMSAGHVHHT